MANTIKVLGTVEIQDETPAKTLRAAAKFAAECGLIRCDAICLEGGYTLEGANDQDTIYMRILKIESFTRRPGVFMAFVDNNLIAVRCTGPVLVSISGGR